MKIIVILTLLSLTSCTTAVKREFPSIPPSLTTTCQELILVDDNATFSAVLSVVTDNYARYHECKLKSEMWLNWYNTQKAIFDMP